jgi:hypothetical protein
MTSSRFEDGPLAAVKCVMSVDQLFIHRDLIDLTLSLLQPLSSHEANSASALSIRFSKKDNVASRAFSSAFSRSKVMVE